MYFNRVPCNLKGRKEAQNSYTVGSLKHLRFELHIKLLCHFSDVPGYTIVVILRPGGQAKQTALHSSLEISINPLNEG